MRAAPWRPQGLARHNAAKAVRLTSNRGAASNVIGQQHVRKSSNTAGHQSAGKWLVSSLFFVGLAAWVLSGCSSAHYRRSADQETYRVLQRVERQIFGKTNQFSIDTPYSARKPEGILPKELIEDRLQTNRRVLSLAGALDLAVTRSRRYQTEKERLYLTALTLTGERHAFRPQFLAGTTANFERTTTGDQIGSVNSSLSVGQLLKSGGQLGLNLANDLLRYYTGDPRRSAISTISVNLAQPLLRGFGRNNPAVEALTQAERNVVYAVRSYSFFQNQFALEIVNDYFDLLTRKDVVRNQYTNYLHRVENTLRLEARQDRETRPGVDQARQSDLGAKNAYVNAVAGYFNALDQFKIKLGLALGERLYLDDRTLAELQQIGLVPVALPREGAYRLAVEKQLPILNAIDQFEDSKRKIRVARDRLRPDLNLLADASLDSDRPTDYTKFDPNLWRGNVGLELNLPLDRLSERNAYRSSLVTFESELRNLTLTLDNLRSSIDRGLRTLEQLYQNYVIQTNALALADSRVDSTMMLQQAGRAEVRDVLDAQDSQIAAQNAVTGALVDYQLARLQLMLDLGTLETEADKFWLQDHLSAYFKQSVAAAESPELPRGHLIPPDELFNE
jgi:outer membrane protein TolC